MITYVVYRARDGHWGYCPSKWRHWNVFDKQGTFPTQTAAHQAALADPKLPKGTPINVEGR